MMANLHSNSHWSSPSSDALRQSSPPEASAAPSASFPAGTDPAVEYGDEDIDGVLSDEPLDGCHNRAVTGLQLQDKTEQKTRSALERRKKKWLAVEMSLYNEPVADSNYNHLDPKHMFAILEQIQRGMQLPPSPATPAAPTTPQHDSFGYAIPCRSGATRNAEPEATSAQEHAYAVVDVTQKQLLHGKNKTTRNEGNKTEPTVAAVVGTNKERIEAYATVDIMAMKNARQKQKAFQGRVTTHNAKQPHNKVEQESTGEVSHKPVDPMYAEVAETGAIATTCVLTTKDDNTIEPYATVDIPYKHKASKKHELAFKASTPINAPFSKLETDQNGICNKATVITA